MTTLGWIVLGGVAMMLLALVGAVTLVLPERVLRAALLPLVAFAAGSLLGGAFFHLLPEALRGAPAVPTFAWMLAGFACFFALEQFLHWRHCDEPGGRRSKLEQGGGRSRLEQGERPRPLTYLILIGDGLHNLLGGVAVASAFITDTRLGLMTWLAAAAHEVPQELGDFGVLVHGGWPKRRALLFNALSGLTFLVGGVATYYVSRLAEIDPLVPFAAGNFVYIAASDLVPEVHHHHRATINVVHFAAFVAGMGLLLALAVLGG